MRKQNFTILTVAGFIIVFLFNVSPALAGTINFHLGDFYKDKIGWDGTYPNSNYDIFDLKGYQDSFSLPSGQSIIMPIASVTFSVGVNASVGSVNTGTLDVLTTINGLTQTLHLPYEVVIDYSDTALIVGGVTLHFGNVTLTTNAWGPFTLSPGSFTKDLTGTFTVPEPQLALLMLLGIACVLGAGLLFRD